jgi:hypothetical protein
MRKVTPPAEGPGAGSQPATREERRGAPVNARSLLLALLVLALVGSPAAQALHSPGDNSDAVQARPYSGDRLGPKYVHVPAVTRVSAPSVPSPDHVVWVVGPRAGAFHWGDASVGAGVAALLLGLVAAAGVLILRRRAEQAVESAYPAVPQE